MCLIRKAKNTVIHTSFLFYSMNKFSIFALHIPYTHTVTKMNVLSTLYHPNFDGNK